ncbi:MAG TPA: ABC transporter permease subunit [Candidatus Saccharimonadales bacterium]|nr:ABC transporter permease subunit [Candidatus Saccharimonadales bacterium]
MIPIIIQGIKQRKWSTFWWSFGVAVYIALNILIYSTVRNQAQAFNTVVSHLPAAAKSLVSDSDILSPVGYLSSKIFYFFLPLLLSILTINLGHNLLAQEEQSGTLELLLSRPVSRARVLLAKLVTGFLILLTVSVTALATTLVCSAAINLDVPLRHIALATLLSASLSLLFGAVAFMLTALGRLGRSASVGIAMLVAIGSYLVTSLESYADWLRYLAKLLPYHYYHPSAVLRGTFNWWSLIGFLIAAATLATIGFKGFKRRDIA